MKTKIAKDRNVKGENSIELIYIKRIKGHISWENGLLKIDKIENV